MSAQIRPVILAGGGGTRLWPSSTADRPKHLLHLVGGQTLLEATLDRVADRSKFAPPLIICSGQQADQIAMLATDATMMVEPEGRNSGPAIAAAAAFEQPETILLVLPSDHHVGDALPLLEAVKRARPLAEQGWIVTFGIRPNRPETGYGYISPGASLGEGAFKASRFVEKPDRDAAAALIHGGSYWNAGMFLLKAETALEEFETHAPEIVRSVQAAVGNADVRSNRVDLERSAFVRCPGISFDHAVMERSGRVAVVPVELDWSDLGTWAAVYELSGKDAFGNVVGGGAAAIDSRGCLIRSEGPRIVAVGVEDLVIVATAMEVLIVPRSEAQRVREAAALAANLAGKPG
jgi:mannose-1-phosphate guanylyltransferase/mannose-6-phosphate isomerase